MKKLLTTLLTLVMLFNLAACGSAKPLGCEGAYSSVAVTALGFTVTGEDADGFELKLENGGKGTYTVEGENGKLKWSLDGNKMTISINGSDFVGEYSQDKLVFTDFMGMGVDCVFAIEGSEAANPANYMPEEAKQLVGEWVSYQVTDILGAPIPESEISPYDFCITLSSDYTAEIVYGEAALTNGGKWSLLGSWGSFEEDWMYEGAPASITFELPENSKNLEVTFSCGDSYYIFTCAPGTEARTTPNGNEAASEEDEEFFPMLLPAVSCTKDGKEYECDQDWVELIDSENGTACMNGVELNIEWVWYDDDSFEFTDENGEQFVGVATENGLSGTYYGYEYFYGWDD